METSGSRSLHDSAAPHKARTTVLQLEGEKLQVQPHPPWLTLLAHHDCGLRFSLKTVVTENKLLRIEDLARAVNSQLHAIPTLETKRFPNMAKATATLCGQHGSIL